MQAKIIVLNENTAGKFCLAEHGLSYWVETPNKYLFDTGSSNLFIENAQRLKLDLSEVETVVISHGHDDHTGGLRYLQGKTLIGHPAIFEPRYRKSNATPLGAPFTQEEAEKKFMLKLTRNPFQLDDYTWFLGEVPRTTPFEATETPFTDELGNDDFTPDDSGMAIVTPNGLVVISGCAHSGICNMLLHAQQVTGTEKIYGVIGGFHLTQADEQTEQTIAFFNKMKIEKVMPSHCTALPALSKFYENFGFMQVKSGNSILF